MKKIVRDLKERGRTATCEGCHKDMDRWALIGDARQRLDDLLKVLGQDNAFAAAVTAAAARVARSPLRQSPPGL